ncbi:MAG: energy transducer TonB [candidate division WOR-3 bacterium]
MRRELLISFAGHVVLIGLVGVLTANRVIKDQRRPITLSIQVVNPGTPLPKTETQGPKLVDPKPKVQPVSKTESKSEPKPKPTSGNQVKRMGLGARIEGADALGYSYYLNAILARIAENWFDPYLGESRRISTTVVFIIERDGSLRDIQVEKSSGDQVYDNAAERALKVLDRLPPLPPEFKAPRLKLHLEFEHTP